MLQNLIILGEKMKKLKIQRGNHKLHKGILTWSLPPILSCVNCEHCSKHCYALKAWKQYPNVRKA